MYKNIFYSILFYNFYSTMSSETITLQVEIPLTCQVGSIINVLFEGNYYEVIVPEGSPGTSIQVVLPSVPVANAHISTNSIDTKGDDYLALDDMPTLNFSEKAHDDQNNTVVESSTLLAENDNKDASSTTTNNKLSAGMVAGAVVGALIIGPAITGAVILSGAAVYVINRKKQTFENNPEILQNPSTMNKAIVKIVEIDENYKISQTISSVTNSIAATVKTTDEKYKISENVSNSVSSTVNAIKGFDEQHKISEQISATASHAVNKTIELDSKYEISSKISNAVTSGTNALLSSLTPLFKGNATEQSSNPNHSPDIQYI